MAERKYLKLFLIILVAIIVVVSLLVACSSGEARPTPSPGVHTWLLVRAPDGPLPVNKPVKVKSRTEDALHQISHVELYAVKSPLYEGELLLRSDRAPFDQTTFTADQVFTPTQPGRYVIKVVGYNKRGQSDESDYLSFEVK